MPEETNQQPQPNTPQYSAPASNVAPVAPTNKGTSGMGIASLVLGILAILSSFIPIINNGAFVLAILGLIFAIVGIIATKNGKKGGRGIAIAGLVLNILSIIIVLATQSLYGAAIDSVTDELENGPQPVAATTETEEAEETPEQETDSTNESAADESTVEEAEDAGEAEAEQASAEEVDYQNLPVGTPVELSNGLSVVVNSVETGLTDYNGDPVTGINITYTNNGTENNSFTPFDWKALDTNGVLDSETFYMDGENQLSSGELTPGGTTSGNVYFDGEITNVYYYDNMFQSNASAGWAL